MKGHGVFSKPQTDPLNCLYTFAMPHMCLVPLDNACSGSSFICNINHTCSTSGTLAIWLLWRRMSKSMNFNCLVDTSKAWQHHRAVTKKPSQHIFVVKMWSFFICYLFSQRFLIWNVPLFGLCLWPMSQIKVKKRSHADRSASRPYKRDSVEYLNYLRPIEKAISNLWD